jgi:hypothetical protein
VKRFRHDWRLATLAGRYLPPQFGGASWGGKAMRHSRKVLAAAVLATVFVAAACTSGMSSVAVTDSLLASCHDQPRWAVGDSVTNEDKLGIPGWPNQGSQYGTWGDLGVPGATAASLSTWLLDTLPTCDVRPSLIVFEAGINDLDAGATAAELESTVTHLVTSVGVPIRVLAITPLTRDGSLVGVEPARVEFNSWLATTYPAIDIDCNAKLADSEGWLQQAFAVDSMLHLTDSGELALSDCIAASL